LKSGLDSHCKQCKANAAKAARQKNPDVYRANNRRWAQENKERLKHLARKYYLENPEKFRLASKKWAENNRDTVAAKNKQWRLDNPEKQKELNAKWRKSNPEKNLLYAHNRRARTIDNGIFDISNKQIAKLLQAGCVYCGGSAEHLDHVIPIARGGSHSIGNLVGACASCNLSKGASTITEWKKRLRISG
jgi:hypothetical protein